MGRCGIACIGCNPNNGGLYKKSTQKHLKSTPNNHLEIMEKFIDIYQKKTESYRGNRRHQNEEIINFINLSDDTRDKINTLFEDAIKNQSIRSEIISKLLPVYNDHKEKFDSFYKERIFNIFKEEITADWLYYEALKILSPQTIEEDGKKFIVGRRRGSNGGFLLTEIIDSSVESNFENAEPEKSIAEIEKEIDETNIQITEVENKERLLERHYYPYVQTWARENGFEKCEITGGLIPGPKWENPDLLEMYFDSGKNIPSMNIEIASFEVKLKIEPQAIWQAAHYTKFSHFTFVAFALTEEEVRSADRIFDLAVNLGIGILVLEKRNSNEIKFKQIHSPTKNNPPSNEIETIVSRFLDGNRFANTKKHFLEEKSRFARQLIGGVNLIIAAD
jgi:hypothetical protein